VSGAGGGLGHFAVQYARCFGATVIAIDTGVTKADYLLANGAAHFVDFATTPDVVSAVKALTPESLGAHAVVVTAASARAFEQAGEMLRPGGALCLCGIPAGEAYLKTPVAGIVIKGLRIFGNLTGSLKECMDAVELVRVGKVVPRVEVRAFEELENVYVRMEKGDILGRVVLRIAKDEV
jgi:propanol-preferring alcohol dehydrogenase